MVADEEKALTRSALSTIHGYQPMDIHHLKAL